MAPATGLAKRLQLLHSEHIFRKICFRNMKLPDISLSRSLFAFLTLLASAGVLVAGFAAGDEKGKKRSAAEELADKQRIQENLPATADEARGRARWMHETIHGALQVMHRDFFGNGEDDLNLPSQSLDDVFLALAETWGVEIQWLGVNATKGAGHEADDDFEKAAARALASGKLEYEAVERGKFRYVGAIQIRNECLKCHVPNRTSLEDRVGGLAFIIPLKKSAER
jgi:hypothetical protein